MVESQSFSDFLQVLVAGINVFCSVQIVLSVEGLELFQSAVVTFRPVVAGVFKMVETVIDCDERSLVYKVTRVGRKGDDCKGRRANLRSGKGEDSRQ